jgi:hypothetical protein
MELLIDVNQDCSRLGRRKNCVHGPIALAITEAFKKKGLRLCVVFNPVLVGSDWVEIYPGDWTDRKDADCLSIPLPQVAKTYLRQYDFGDDPGPINFTITIPDDFPRKPTA